MTSRAVLGLHPYGNFGLFITKPGYDALSTNPATRAGWALNTERRVASIIMAGNTYQDLDVYFPSGLSFSPYVWWEHWDGGSNFFPADVRTVIASGNITGEGASRYTVQQSANSSFRIVRTNTLDDATGQFFRFAVYNLPIQ